MNSRMTTSPPPKTAPSPKSAKTVLERLDRISERSKLALYVTLLTSVCIGGAVVTAVLPH